MVVYDLDKDEKGFESWQDVPGADAWDAKGHRELIAYLNHNLANRTLCLQATATGVPRKTVKDDKGKLIAAYGWRVVQELGKGKDGETFWGHRYGDLDERKHVVKVKSSYGKLFDNHSRILNDMFRKLHDTDMKKPQILIDQVIKTDFNHYQLKTPFTHIVQEPRRIHKALAEVCRMNDWLITNTGFVFWDMGYSNGRNFMMDDRRSIRWVDYGGAGMLRCPNFNEVYNSYGKNMTVLDLGTEHQGGWKPINGKESLVIGDSDFVMCQFLLNYEFWSEPETTADLYSSILQVKRQVIPEIVELLPKLIKTKVGKEVYNDFKNQNWLEALTWRRLGKHFNANT